MIVVDDIEIAPIKTHDAWKLCDFVCANESHLKRYFPKTLQQNLTPALAEIFTEKKVKAFKNRTEFLFTLKNKLTREFLGLIYIKKLDWDKKQGEFAYCIDYRFAGNGITSRSVAALSDYAFKDLGIDTLQIIAHKDHIASIKVAKKNHFKWISTLKKSYTPPSEHPLDMELFELYNHEK